MAAATPFCRDPGAPVSSNPIPRAASEKARRPRRHSPAKQASIKQSSAYQYGGRESCRRHRCEKRSYQGVGGRVPIPIIVGHFRLENPEANVRKLLATRLKSQRSAHYNREVVTLGAPCKPQYAFELQRTRSAAPSTRSPQSQLCLPRQPFPLQLRQNIPNTKPHPLPRRNP